MQIKQFADNKNHKQNEFMIYDDFLPFLIIFSIFSIIIILARKIPDISFKDNEYPGNNGHIAQKPHFLTTLFCLMLSYFEKILRQIRIHILKLDAKIFSLIEYLRKESAKKFNEVNKLSYKNIAKAVMEDNANRISRKLQFRIEEKKILHIIARNPKKSENYKKLGLLYFDNKNLTDAMDAFKEYLNLNPEDIEIKKVVQKIESKKYEKNKVPT